MKRLAMAAVLALTGTIAAADPLEGQWRTAADDNGNSGLIVVGACPSNGALLCGQLVQAYGPDGSQIASDNVGRMIIFDTAPHSGNEYRGKVYSPDRDATYNSRLTLSGNSLSVQGCVLGVCRDGGTWQRAN